MSRMYNCSWAVSRHCLLKPVCLYLAVPKPRIIFSSTMTRVNKSEGSIRSPEAQCWHPCFRDSSAQCTEGWETCLSTVAVHLMNTLRLREVGPSWKVIQQLHIHIHWALWNMSVLLADTSVLCQIGLRWGGRAAESGLNSWPLCTPGKGNWGKCS